MDAWTRQFETIRLPYDYVTIPTPKEKDIPRTHLKYYVNKVITNLTRDTFRHSGFTVTTNKRMWNASWGRQYTMDEYQKCLAWQKINHFAGAFLMGRKDNLHKRMLELQARVGPFADFYPESYLLPDEKESLEARWAEVPTWIVKPSASSRGRGIHLVSSQDSEIPTDDGIVQRYLASPFLITRRKFDIRLYIYIPTIKPLRIYIHSAGLARFCTAEYKGESTSIDDVHRHLTNFTLNKDNPEFQRCQGSEEKVSDSKWSLAFFNKYMEENGISSAELMKKFEKVSIMTIIAGMCEIRKTHCTTIPHRHTSHEMYGIDIMLDDQMNAHLIEINISPSLSGLDSQLDRDLKYPLNLDLLRMGRIIDCDCMKDSPCPGVEILDDHYFASMTTQRVKAVESGEVDPWDDPVFADFVIIRDYLEERQIESGFRMIYPLPETMEQYLPCFDKLSYQDIVFNAWITMSDERRHDVLRKHWQKYVEEMALVNREVAEAPDTFSE